MSEIRDHLIFKDEAWTTLAKMNGIERHRPEGFTYASVEELIIAEGEDFAGAPLPDRYERGPMGLCFMNALLLAVSHPELTYVEGYGSSLLMPLHHAWCVDTDGVVVDPTWDEPEGRTYLGVRFPTELALEIAQETEIYGILGIPTGRSEAILKSGVIA